MTILVVPADGGQQYDGSAVSDKYFVTGTTDIYAAYAALQAEVPSTSGSLVRDSIKLKSLTCEHWEADIEYVDAGSTGGQYPDPSLSPDIGELDWDYDTMGGTQHITQGLAPTAIFSVPGHNPKEFQRAIDVSRTGRGQWNVKGTDIVVPKGEVTVTTSFAPDEVNLEWRRALKKLVGKTNNVPWKVWDKGEMKFLGMRIKTRHREKTACTFSFLESENITAADNITIGGLNNAGGVGASPPIEMTGHQFLWVYSEQDESEGQVLMKPKQACVETVCREGDFSILKLGN